MRKKLKQDLLNKFDPLRISGLGPLRILLGNNDLTTVNWRTKKVRDLLIYLAHYQEPATRERIIENLWPDYEKQKPINLFHTTLYWLRQLLHEYTSHDLIIFKGGRYQLLDNNLETDWRRFEKLVLSADEKGVLSDLCARQLEEAVQLYRGHYLEELDYPWLHPYQEYYRNLYIQTRLRLARFYLTTKEYQKASLHLLRLMENDFLMDEAHILMMTIYNESGDRIGAFRHYQKMAKAYGDEYGISPPPEAVRLYNTIHHLKIG